MEMEICIFNIGYNWSWFRYWVRLGVQSFSNEYLNKQKHKIKRTTATDKGNSTKVEREREKNSMKTKMH